MRAATFMVSVPGFIFKFFRDIQFNVLTRPKSWRDLRKRVVIVTAMVIAGFLPALISTQTDSVEDVAGASFSVALADLDTSRAQLDDLRDAEIPDPDQIVALEQRVAILEDRTFIGYIERPGDAPKEGALIPDFRLLDITGNAVRLSDIGKPTIINFWASWCPFCIEEMPDIQLLHQKIGDRVTIIGINRGESLSTAQRFATSTGAQYTLLLDLDDELGGRGGPYQVIGMPTTLYVGADGRVQSVKIGFQTLEQMVELSSGLLDEQISIESITGETVDTSDAARSVEIVESQLANHAVANELFARFAADTTLVDDIAWQRNVVAQARAWEINEDEFQTLTPPANGQVLFDDVIDAFRLLQTSGALLRAGIDAADADQVARGIALFQGSTPVFDQAADNFTGFIETQ